MTGKYPQNAPWESRNGYIPPPRFQLLRALDNLQQQQQLAPARPSQTQMSPSHSRSPSFFSFFRSKNSTNAQTSAASSLSTPRNQGVPYEPQQPQQPRQPQQPSFVPLNQPSRPQSQPQSETNMARDPNPQQTGLTRTLSMQETSQSPISPSPIHPEIRSLVQLDSAHRRKIYYAGPLVRKLEHQTDGQKPHKDDGWVDVWAQLAGTILSIWDLKETQEASRQGREVPPSYVNVTDAFVQVVGNVIIQGTTGTPSKRYANVLTLNTAGSNLLLFSCPSPAALLSWAAALRLASWEKSRLEEIYTAHLIRINISTPNVPTTLVRGKMEGWARIRIAGQTDWKRVWISVQEGTEGNDKPVPAAPPSATIKRKRVSLFSRDSGVRNDLSPKPMIAMFASPKVKDRKKPIMTVLNVTQAFGVYPERPELISRSTLIKVEGTFGDDDIAADLRLREGWVFIMPELVGTEQAKEMLKWIRALHDAFDLYGRPEAWTWDPRDPISMMFGYPVGPLRDNLFLDREVVEKMDPRNDRTSIIRAEFKTYLSNQLKSRSVSPAPHPPALPPVASVLNNNASNAPMPPVASVLNNNASNAPMPPVASILNNNASNAPMPPPPGLSQDTGSPLPLPQLPPFNFGAIDTPTTSIPVSVQPRQRLMERSNFTIHERALSFISPSTTNNSATEKNGHQQQQPSLDMKMQPAILSETNAPPSPSHSSGTPTPILTPTPSMLTLDAKITKIEIPSLTLNSSTMAPVTNPHHSPTTTISTLTNPHHSPTQSIFTNSLHGSEHSESPTTIHFSSSRDLNDSSSFLANPSSPIPHSAGSNQASEAINSTQPFPNVLLENARTTTQDTVTNQPTKDESVNGQIPNEAGLSQSPQAKNIHRGDTLGPVTAVETTGDVAIDSKYSSAQRNSTISAASSWKSTVKPSASSRVVGRLNPARSGLGRKPSGARAQLTPRSYNRESFSSPTLTEEEEEENMPEENNLKNKEIAYDDADAEALAALTYLDMADSQDVSASATPPSPPQHHSPIITPPSAERPRFQLSDGPSIPTAMLSSDSVPFRSSFAPSNKVAERIMKAQAQQAAQEAAKHRPGRANGKKKAKAVATGAWESSDEEDDEEEEDEEDEDVDSDAEVPMRGPQSNSSQQGFSSSSSSRPPQSTSDSNVDGPPSHLRPPRNLPVPPGRLGDEQYPPQSRRMTADLQQLQHQQQQFTEFSRRTYHDGTQIRTQAEVPHPGAARQNVWSQVLDPGRGQPDQPSVRDTFVQLDPAETMTKAFTPQGLLSAGLQDKEDRSAKRQEELARESGGSLINVPNKPPPPQTGLLGAITAHERERKREGGVGAALTEREREKRIAEERQRKFDEHQRQQLDQMQQGGSMYGGGYNPMMGNPMMMGMNPMMPMMTGGGLNPMMTGGGGMQPMTPMMTGQMGQMGYPGMIGGFNPHMFAAQQAAQAYQQAMMAFSVAGSQVGPPDGGGGPPQGNQNMNPGMMQGMNPAMTGGMGGFDPRMSMMGMPMMGMGMGMGMGLPQMGGQMPLGMQMTGMSGFDPRSSQGNGLANGNNNEGGLLPPINAQFSSRTSSPASRGSPLARGANDSHAAPDPSPNPK